MARLATEAKEKNRRGLGWPDSQMLRGSNLAVVTT